MLGRVNPQLLVGPTKRQHEPRNRPAADVVALPISASVSSPRQQRATSGLPSDCPLLWPARQSSRSLTTVGIKHAVELAPARGVEAVPASCMGTSPYKAPRGLFGRGGPLLPAGPSWRTGGPFCPRKIFAPAAAMFLDPSGVEFFQPLFLLFWVELAAVVKSSECIDFFVQKPLLVLPKRMPALQCGFLLSLVPFAPFLLASPFPL